MADEQISDSKLAELELEQISAIEVAQQARVGSDAAGVVGTGISIFIIISSFCSGLVGWLLTMRKCG